MHNGAVTESSWPGSSRDRGRAMVHRSAKLWLCAGSLLVLRLSSHGRGMSLTSGGLLFGPRTRGDPTIATVVADPVHRGGVVDDGCVVHVVNVGDVHIVHRTVVIKLPVLPTSTLVAFSKVSVAITDSAIETDLLTPVALIEDVAIATPTPIGWSPEQSRFRSHHPRTWHPVVIVVIVGVSPVAGGPEITFSRTKRLLIDGELWRGE